ncbi:MAG: lysostaphin resistance A-like protein [Mycobacterium leprae]
MLPERSLAPLRAAGFYSTALFLLLFLSAPLQGAWQLVGALVNELCLFLGLALLFTVYLERRPLRTVFRLRPLSPGGIVKSLMLGAVAWALAEAMGLLITLLVQHFGGQIPEPHQALMQAPFLVALVIGALLPAVAEEAAFRGYLLWGMGPLGPVTAVLLNGLLFGAMHLTLVRILPLMVLGLIFAAAVQRSGSILPGVIMHALNNTVTLALAFYYNPAQSAGGPALASPAGVLELSVAVAALGVGAWILVRQFDRSDLAAGVRTTAGEVAAGEEDAGQPLPLRRLLLPLLPAILLYGWVVVMELRQVFGR